VIQLHGYLSGQRVSLADLSPPPTTPESQAAQAAGERDSRARELGVLFIVTSLLVVEGTKGVHWGIWHMRWGEPVPRGYRVGDTWVHDSVGVRHPTIIFYQDSCPSMQPAAGRLLASK
jgi:hypothetical protein